MNRTLWIEQPNAAQNISKRPSAPRDPRPHCRPLSGGRLDFGSADEAERNPGQPHLRRCFATLNTG
jgi:hypothetical protein